MMHRPSPCVNTKHHIVQHHRSTDRLYTDWSLRASSSSKSILGGWFKDMYHGTNQWSTQCLCLLKYHNTKTSPLQYIPAQCLGEVRGFAHPCIAVATTAQLTEKMLVLPLCMHRFIQLCFGNALISIDSANELRQPSKLHLRSAEIWAEWLYLIMTWLRIMHLVAE